MINISKKISKKHCCN